MVPALAIASTLGLALSTPPAHAANCASIAKLAATAKGPDLVSAYGRLADCDKTLAENEYKSFMKSATDTDTLHGLSMAALDREIWNPVWKQLEFLEYGVRDQVTERIGGECAEKPKIITFLTSAYLALRDIEFQRWEKAFQNCDSDELDKWLVEQVVAPPNKMFDEKYNGIVSIYVKKHGAAALPSLTKGAIQAADGGPYDALLMQMDEAVAAELGGEISTEDKQALEAALVEVASNVNAEKARAVADRLATAGAGAAAARLLPRIYPDRLQSSGGFLYGAAAVESGECKGEKLAVLHVAEVSEPGKRWLIMSDVETAMKGMKPKLKNCSGDAGAWPVATTPEPVKTAKEIDGWVEGLEKQWAEKGYEVKVQSEKDVALN